GVADAADPLGIDFRNRRQVIKGADSVLNAVASQVCPKQIEWIAKHGVFTADKVETRLLLLRVPELATFSLTDRIVVQNNVAALDQVDVQHLIRGRRLALGRVATWAENAGHAPRDAPGLIEEGRHEVTRKAFEHELFDDVIRGLDRAQDLGRW